MATITDAAARAALRAPGVKTLTDKAPRGHGRLVLICKHGRGTWYAAHYVAGKRQLRALGQFPAMSVAQARQAFGATPHARAGKALTFAAMVDAYLDWRRDNLPASYRNCRIALLPVVAQLGRHKLAAEVAPADITAVLRPVFDRGSRGQAAKVRSFLKAAFQWALDGQHDYTKPGSRDWKLASNPVAAVPRDRGAYGVGTRCLTPAELDGLLAWMLRRPEQSARCMVVLALTGQRVREITQLQRHQWDSAARVLRWEKTKTGKPHSIPVCDLAARMLDAFTWEAVDDEAMLSATRRHSARAGIPKFTPRDLRRTWTTLAGDAGLSERERKLLQNHAGEAGDVQAKHYDRAEYLDEKRAAVTRWQAWLIQKVSAYKADCKADDVIDGNQ